MDEGLEGGTRLSTLLRNKKVILIVLVVLLLLVGGGFLLWQNLQGDDNPFPTQQDAGEMKEKYNSYVNYVLFGEESTEAPSFETMEEAQPYFESLQGGGEGAYLEQANYKYGELQEAYLAYDGDLAVNMETLKLFFQDLARVQDITMAEIANTYVAGGEKAVENLIIERFANNGTKLYFDDYLNAERDYAELLLRIVINAGAAGCINGNQLVEGCYTMTETEGMELNNKLSGVMTAKNTLRYNAMETLEIIYDDLYGLLIEDEEED